MGDLISEIGVLFGGGPNNSRFTAQAAPIAQPTTPEQAQQAYVNAQQGLDSSKGLVNALIQQGGIQNQSNVFGQLGDLRNQYGAIASGQGPNPAQAALANATGRNVANQAALMASQRGASTNPALVAKNAARLGADIQQQAAGQGAALQAQQSLNALGQQSGISGLQAGIAGQQVGNAMGAQNAYNQAAQGLQHNILNSIYGQNQANVAQQNSINASNVGIARTNADNSAKAIGGLFNGAASALFPGGGAPAAPAGAAAVPVAAKGGLVEQDQILPPHLQSIHKIYYADGGKVMNMKFGGAIPGQASVSGDSLKNDTVPAMLSPGEIVLPRSVVQSSSPEVAAANFVADVKKDGKKSPESDFREALKQAISRRKKK